MSDVPFADVSDIEARWRPLSAAETTVADALLDDASDLIRNRFGDIDARLDSGSITEATLVRVVVGMVRRAMLSPGFEGVESLQQTTGPFSVNAKYVNPAGNLYLSADDVRALTLNGYTTQVKVGWLA